MTAGHKIAISNLIYFHQYLLMRHEFRMFSLHTSPTPHISEKGKCVQLSRGVPTPLPSSSGSVNLYYPPRPVSKSQSAIVVWITSDKTSPFVCLAVGSVQVMFALSHSLPAECAHAHRHTRRRAHWYYRESDFNRRC